MSLLPSSSDASPPEDAAPRVVGVDSEDADDVLSALSSGTARELLAAVHDDPAPPSELADRVDTTLQNAQYHLEKLEDAGAIEVVDTAYSAKGREMDVYAPADQPLVIFAGEQSEGATLQTALKRFLGSVGILAGASLVVQAVAGQGRLLPSWGMGSAPEDGGAGGAAPTATGTPTETVGEFTIQTTATETAHQPTVTEGVNTAVESATQTPTEIATQTATDIATQTPTPEVTQTPTETLTRTATQTPETLRTAGETLPPGLLFFAGGLVALALVGGVWYLRQ